MFSDCSYDDPIYVPIHVYVIIHIWVSVHLNDHLHVHIKVGANVHIKFPLNFTNQIDLLMFIQIII